MSTPVHPCGSQVDWIRTAYQTKARLWANDSTQVTIRWFRCEPNAMLVPQPNLYVSGIWDDAKSWPLPTVGDVPPLAFTYDKGGNPLGYRGTNYCGDPDAWASGGRLGITPAINTGADGSSGCCAGFPVIGQGGLGLGGRAFWGQNYLGLCPMDGFCTSTVIMPSHYSGLCIGKGLCVSTTSFVPVTRMGYTVYYNWGGNATTTNGAGRLLVGASTQTHMTVAVGPATLQLNVRDNNTVDETAVLQGIGVGSWIKIWSTLNSAAFGFYQVTSVSYHAVFPQYYTFGLQVPGTGTATFVTAGTSFGVSPYTPPLAGKSGYTIISAFDIAIANGEWWLSDAFGFPITTFGSASGTGFLEVSTLDANGVDVTSVLAAITTSNFVRYTAQGDPSQYGYAQITSVTYNPGTPSYTFGVTFLAGIGVGFPGFPVAAILSFM